MARMRLQSHFFTLLERVQDQDPRGDSSINCKPLSAINTKTHVIGAKSCLLEGETQPKEAFCMVDKADLH